MNTDFVLPARSRSERLLESAAKTKGNKKYSKIFFLMNCFLFLPQTLAAPFGRRQHANKLHEPRAKSVFIRVNPWLKILSDLGLKKDDGTNAILFIAD